MFQDSVYELWRQWHLAMSGRHATHALYQTRTWHMVHIFTNFSNKEWISYKKCNLTQVKKLKHDLSVHFNLKNSPEKSPTAMREEKTMFPHHVSLRLFQFHAPRSHVHNARKSANWSDGVFTPTPSGTTPSLPRQLHRHSKQARP